MSAIHDIRKKYGKGSLILMSEEPEVGEDPVSTGSAMLDRALGIGGFPRGRVVEIYGPESSGKTTLALHAVASAQASGGVCAYIDVENALDPTYASAIGVDVDKLYLAQPDTGEEALNMACDLAASGEIAVLVIDSVAALVPRAELEGDVGDAHVGLQARMMGQALRKISHALKETGTLCIFINQIREKIGVMYGSPETTPGGRALKFFASVRLDIRAQERIVKDSEIFGTRTKVTVKKNKVGVPFKIANFDIIYGQGISKEGSLLDLALEQEVVTKKGAWFYFGEAILGQGRDNVREFLADNEDVRNEITNRVGL